MSHCETVGWGNCNCCGGAVAIKRNRSGKAYYRCDWCGVQVQHHWAKNSDKIIQSLGVVQPPPENEQKPEKVEKPVEKPKPKPGSLASMFGSM